MPSVGVRSTKVESVVASSRRTPGTATLGGGRGIVDAATLDPRAGVTG
jgi:hypothetical protein